MRQAVRLSLTVLQHEMCAETSCWRAQSFGVRIQGSGVGGGVNKQDVTDAGRKADTYLTTHTAQDVIVNSLPSENYSI